MMPKLNETALPLGTTTIDAGTLERDLTYYWRVDEVLNNGPNVIEGNVWMFETELSMPTIEDQPHNSYVKHHKYRSVCNYKKDIKNRLNSI